MRTPVPKPRRIVRRAVMAMAVAVLLLNGYVASVGTLYMALGAGVLPQGVTETAAWRAYTTPSWGYINSGSPGSGDFRDLIEWCANTGDRMRGN